MIALQQGNCTIPSIFNWLAEAKKVESAATFNIFNQDAPIHIVRPSLEYTCIGCKFP